jgi:hypothetical protein
MLHLTDLDTLKIESADDFEVVNALLYRLGVTDGLPVVPPTAPRIDAMLNGRDPDIVLTQLPPLRGRATMYKLAMCAVMAGCHANYFPIILAAIEAVEQPEFNLYGIQTTTGNATPMILLNGPIIDLCHVNAGANALGPGIHSNATIGRAIQLILKNIGGAVPGYTDKATLGQPGKYTFCCAENEGANPWEPLHVTRGYPSEQSTVTVIGASGIVEVVDANSYTSTSVLLTLAHSMTIAGTMGGSSMLGGGEPLLLITPEHADLIAQDYTRHQAQQFLFDTARLPLQHLPPETVKRIQDDRETEGMDPEADIRIAACPEDIMLVVVGGAGIKSAYVPTWGGTTRAVTRPIDLSCNRWLETTAYSMRQ